MTAVIKFRAGPSEDGKTAEYILKKRFGVSSKLMVHLKLNGKISINEKICRSIDVLRNGDVLCADVSENCAQSEIEPFFGKFEVLYEDDFILVVNKPGNMAVHPSLGNRTETLANAVMYYWREKGEYHMYHIVNRLDKNTSGICVIAKNSYAHARLSQQMKSGEFGRRYKAVVHGVLTPKNGVIEIPIRREAESIIKRIASPDGKYAKTVYETQKIFKDKFSLVDVELKTGRTHQIRVHFSHMGCPLVGDFLYGDENADKALINRQALHAGFLKMRHPLNGKSLVFEAEPPGDILRLLEILNKI